MKTSNSRIMHPQTINDAKFVCNNEAKTRTTTATNSVEKSSDCAQTNSKVEKENICMLFCNVLSFADRVIGQCGVAHCVLLIEQYSVGVHIT